VSSVCLLCRLWVHALAVFNNPSTCVIPCFRSGPDGALCVCARDRPMRLGARQGPSLWITRRSGYRGRLYTTCRVSGVMVRRGRILSVDTNQDYAFVVEFVGDEGHFPKIDLRPPPWRRKGLAVVLLAVPDGRLGSAAARAGAAHDNGLPN
jgi:hypothetical protein